MRTRDHTCGPVPGMQLFCAHGPRLRNSSSLPFALCPLKVQGKSSGDQSPLGARPLCHCIFSTTLCFNQVLLFAKLFFCVCVFCFVFHFSSSLVQSLHGVMHSNPRHTWGPLPGVWGLYPPPWRTDGSSLCWWISPACPRAQRLQPGQVVPGTNCHYQTTQPVSTLIVSFVQNPCPGIHNRGASGFNCSSSPAPG